MIFLLDSHLSPAVSAWINREYAEHSASSLRSYGLSGAEDSEVFDKARELGAVLITKDIDFAYLVRGRLVSLIFQIWRTANLPKHGMIGQPSSQLS